MSGRTGNKGTQLIGTGNKGTQLIVFVAFPVNAACA
jgi:hypothetical protein